MRSFGTYVLSRLVDCYNYNRAMNNESAESIAQRIANANEELMNILGQLPYWNICNRQFTTLDEVLTQLIYDREEFCDDFNIRYYNDDYILDYDDTLYESAIIKVQELKRLYKEYEGIDGREIKHTKTPIEAKAEAIREYMNLLPVYNRSNKAFNTYDEIIEELIISRGTYREEAGLRYNESDRYIELYNDLIEMVKELKKYK